MAIAGSEPDATAGGTDGGDAIIDPWQITAATTSVESQRSERGNRGMRSATGEDGLETDG